MARAPKPPKLRIGGLNPLQTIIIGVFVGLITPMFLIPFGAGLLLKPRGAWEFFYDGLMDWGILFCIAATLFLLVTPEFWAFVWRTAKRNKQDFETATNWADIPWVQSAADYLGTIILFGCAVGIMALIFLGSLQIIDIVGTGWFPFNISEAEKPNERFIIAGAVTIVVVLVLALFMPWESLGARVGQLIASIILQADRGNREHQSTEQDFNSANGTRGGGDNRKGKTEQKASQDQGHADDEFAYDPNAFGREKSAEDTRPPPPRGYEKRHPSDVKLWAVVDDPAASEQERKTALEVVLRRESKRKSD